MKIKGQTWRGRACYAGSVFGLFAPALWACEISESFELNVHPVFNEADPDTHWLHRLANFLHIETKPTTLEKELAFLSPCETDPERLYEAERYLRSRAYLRDAKVSLVEDEDRPRLKIDTWDTWSLMPVLDFGRTGGKNHFEVGIKDRNLLGHGIDAELAYFSDPERTGYKLDTGFPLHFLKGNTQGRIRLIDSPDGYQRALHINRPFVTTQTDWAAALSINSEDRIDTQFHNANDEYLYRHEIDYRQVALGWRLSAPGQQTLRLLTGLTQDEHYFSEPESGYLPKNRVFRYPWLGLEWLQDDFVTLHNLHLIEHKEDINLGWHIKGSIGYNLDDSTHNHSLIWTLSASKGVAWDEETLLLGSLEASGYDGGSASGSMRGQLNAEILHRLDPKWAWFASASWQFSDRPDLDRPITLGGDNGLRGYPLQYLHGEGSLLLSAELRHYPRINLFKVFELGGALFYDAGRTYGDSPFANIATGWQQDIGIGARFYSSHSSENQVIHVDLVHPFSRDADVSSLEFRIEVKHAF